VQGGISAEPPRVEENLLVGGVFGGTVPRASQGPQSGPGADRAVFSPGANIFPL